MQEIVVKTGGEIDTSAKPINEAHRLAQQSAEDAIDYAISCGQLLIEKKKTISHGEWIPWIEAKCDFDRKRASRYMKAANVAPASHLSMDEKLALGRDIWGHKPKRPPASFPDPAELPHDIYSLIYADPPWRYEFSETDSRKIENQYPTMLLEDICTLPVSEIAADDCILFLWATSPKLIEAISVIEAWGFDYRTSAIWIKPQLGMGYYFRQQHEFLLVAIKGAPGVPEPEFRQRSVLEFPRTKHSAKPKEYYEIIEKMYPRAKRIELFCREPQEGWAAWGNQGAA